MKIALHDHEDKKYPNLALMKLSSYHKILGDNTEWFDGSKKYDRVYSSKVFTWTKRDPALPSNTICGGTGFGLTTTLPEVVEHCCPDYSLYGITDKSYGFLTRGCLRKCKDCFVPEKEGPIRPHADILEFFVQGTTAILMDNNILAHQHGIRQIEKMIKLSIKVDFNQGLDARLIDNPMAKLLSRLKWSPSIRLACDSTEIIPAIEKAVELLRWHNASPPRFFCYVLSKDFESTYERVRFLRKLYVDPFIQTLRNKEDTFVPSQRMMDLKRWCNNRRIFRSCPFEEYKTEAQMPTGATK